MDPIPTANSFRRDLFQELGLTTPELGENEKSSIIDHAEAVVRQNQTLNLTRIIDPKQVASRHVADSLVARRFVRAGATQLVDLGTGAGWPGVVIAVTCPTLKVDLIDSTRKKVEFLDQYLKETSLHPRVRAVWTRFEASGFKERLLSADIVTARAVASMEKILSWLPREYRGELLLWKGPKVEEELRAARHLLKREKRVVEEKLSYTLPGDPAERYLVRISSG